LQPKEKTAGTFQRPCWSENGISLNAVVATVRRVFYGNDPLALVKHLVPIVCK
jgi:hypothetical protein